MSRSVAGHPTEEPLRMERTNDTRGYASGRARARARPPGRAEAHLARCLLADWMAYECV